MRVISYTRSTSCLFGEEIPKNVIRIQNEHITEYAKRQGWSIHQKYSDRKVDQEEDFAFQQMLADGILRKFDLVIVDSVFRAGKDLGSAKEVLLQTFHMAGIWFAVVEDDFCSIGKSNDEVEAYFEAKYTTYRTTTMRRRVTARNAQGRLSWNDVKYGYRLSADDQLEIDKNTAPVVFRIFQECAEGRSLDQIASELQEEKILIPMMMRGIRTHLQDPYKWTTYGVKRILLNTAYCGHWVKSFKGQEFPMECIPIVSEELFEKANNVMGPVNSVVQGGKNKFAGLIADEDGNPTMRYRQSKSGERYFYAKTGLRHNNPRIDVEKVEEILHDYLRREHAFALFAQERILLEGELRIERIYSEIGAKISDIAERVAALEKERVSLYRKKAYSETDSVLYENFVNDSAEEYAQLEESIREYEARIKEAELTYSGKNPWLQMFLQYDEYSDLNKEMLHRCIHRIIFRGVDIIRVDFVNSGWRDKFPTEWRDEYGS